MGVLSNKINNCSETFVKNVQQQLNRYSSILNKLNLGRMYQNEEQIPPNFNNLTQDQLKELYYISNQYLKFNNSELSQQQQNKLKKVAIFQQIVNNSKIICPSLLSDIKNILTRVSCYLNSFTYQEFLIFKQTNFQQSNQLKVTLNQNQQSSIYLAQNISGNIVFSKVINTKVYIFRFLLNQNFYIHNGYLRIGIQLFDKIDTEVINDCKKYGFSSQKDFKHKIVKGNSLNSEDVSKTYQELEFRFCLSKKLFYFSDYPNYNSVNMIEKDLISENDLYGFGVSIQNLGLDLNLTNTYFQLQDYQNDQQVTKFQ